MIPHQTQSVFALGVDGGGSKTLAIIVNEHGQEVGRGTAGSANYHSIGLEKAAQHIHTAAMQAAQAAHCQLPLYAAWLGLAGVDRASDLEHIAPYLAPLATHVQLTNDAELLLAGLEHALGVVLIAGTGSIAWGRDADGHSARAGGWGHLLGDEGSGYAIAQQALQAAVRASDGRGPHTLLLTRILDAWQLHKAEQLISHVYSEPDKARIASLSSVVLRCADAGDAIATAIVQHAAQELALAVRAVSQNLTFPQQEIPLALGGGLLLNEAEFRTQVLQDIHQNQSIKHVVCVAQPALSAARVALRLTSEPLFTEKGWLPHA